MTDNREWYKKLMAEQGQMNRQEVLERLQAGELPVDRTEEDEPVYAPKPEHVFDPMTAPKSNGHRWIDRGIKWSCEDAGHAMHQHFKVKETRVLMEQ